MTKWLTGSFSESHKRLSSYKFVISYQNQVTESFSLTFSKKQVFTFNHDKLKCNHVFFCFQIKHILI